MDEDIGQANGEAIVGPEDAPDFLHSGGFDEVVGGHLEAAEPPEETPTTHVPPEVDPEDKSDLPDSPSHPRADKATEPEQGDPLDDEWDPQDDPMEQEEEREASDDRDDDAADEDEQFDSEKPLTRRDRDEIAKSEPLSRVYKSMQRRFTERSQDLSVREHAVDLAEQQLEGFRETVRDEDKFAQFLGNVMQNEPNLVMKAFDHVLTGEQRMDAVLQVAMDSPAEFKKVYEQWTELQDDPAKREHFMRESEQLSKTRQLEQWERQLARQNYDAHRSQIAAKAQRIANQLRVPDRWKDEVLGELQRDFDPHVAKDGSINFSDAQIRESVERVKQRLDAQYARFVKGEREHQARQSQRNARRKARGSRQKGARPQSTTRRGPARRPRTTRPKTQEGRDRQLDAVFDRLTRQHHG